MLTQSGLHGVSTRFCVGVLFLLTLCSLLYYSPAGRKDEHGSYRAELRGQRVRGGLLPTSRLVRRGVRLHRARE